MPLQMTLAERIRWPSRHNPPGARRLPPRAGRGTPPRPAPQRGRGPQLRVSWACWSWSSWAGHSTSRDSAAAQLQVPGRFDPARQPLRLHPRLDPADLAASCSSKARRVAHRVDERRNRSPGRRHRPRACPQQRLGLPDRGPALVVLGVGVERTHQRAVVPLGTQVGVHLEGRLRPTVAGCSRFVSAGVRRTPAPLVGSSP